MAEKTDKKKPVSSPIPETANDRCFIVTQIGDDQSPIRRSADGLIDAVIAPVLDNFKLELHVSHRQYDAGSINRQIVKHLLEDKLVIANLTDLNPNAMYELAVRHAIRKPVVTMAEKGTTLPFDIRDHRTIFYIDNFFSVLSLRDDLKKSIEAALADSLPNNPIYDVAETMVIRSDFKPGSTEEYFAAKFDELFDLLGSKKERVSAEQTAPPTTRYILVCKPLEKESVKQLRMELAAHGFHFASSHKSLGNKMRVFVDDRSGLDRANVLSQLGDTVKRFDKNARVIPPTG